MKVAIETETYVMDLNRDGDGFLVNIGIDTGEPQLNIKYKKKKLHF